MLHLIALSVWAALMFLIVLIVSMPPSTDDQVRTADVQAVEPKPSVETAGSPVLRASNRPASQPSGLTVTLIANRECWISVATDNEQPRDRLLKASETLTVQAHDSVTVKAGNAAALSLRINDQPTAPLGVEGQVVTRRITLENHRTFLMPSAETALAAQVQ